MPTETIFCFKGKTFCWNVCFWFLKWQVSMWPPSLLFPKKAFAPEREKFTRKLSHQKGKIGVKQGGPPTTHPPDANTQIQKTLNRNKVLSRNGVSQPNLIALKRKLHIYSINYQEKWLFTFQFLVSLSLLKQCPVI